MTASRLPKGSLPLFIPIPCSVVLQAMRPLPLPDLKGFLDEKAAAFNGAAFIETDPISIAHGFRNKEDREISGFMTALLAWGQRPVILRNASNLMLRMDHRPADFIRHHSTAERKSFGDFVHRTFQGADAVYLLKTLQRLYVQSGGLENAFTDAYKASEDMGMTISMVRQQLLAAGAPKRFYKHIADPMANSSAKRINMFLRWMVRRDNNGVDFGIWRKIPMSALYCPLDLHSGRVSRMLGLLSRKQDDWKAVVELTENLRRLDASDPVKYDFALYGLGINENFGVD